MKKLRIISLSVVMCIMATVASFAINSETVVITDDTVITEENIYAVAEYVGLSDDAIVERDASISQSQVTVGELKEIMAYMATQPKYITDIDDGVMEDIPTVDIARATGVKTAYYTTNVTEAASVTYSAQGRYYKSGSTKYWTQAVSSNISANSSDGPITYKVSKVYTQTLTLHNGSTSSSYLKLAYNYDVTAYLGVGDVAVGVNSFNISGHHNFYGSSCL
ncbi:MAG: hypothetical protein Q4D42_00050 [Eubacteriales bacterium]|nr:hypothetical protein [Eubacteriales bacterium]